MWGVNKKTLELESLTGPYKFGSGRLQFGKKYKWKPGINIDKKCDACTKENLISEERCSKCRCGFYSSKEQMKIDTHGNYIVGRVGVYGRVCEAEKGYRSQKAIPLSIVDAMGVSFDDVEKIAKKYNMQIDKREERTGLGVKVGLYGYGAIVAWLWISLSLLARVSFIRPNLAEQLYTDIGSMVLFVGAFLFILWMSNIYYSLIRSGKNLSKHWRKYDEGRKAR